LFCRRVLARQPITIHGDGQQVRDFVYVDDVVRAFAAAMAAATTEARVFCICTGRQTSILEISSLLGDLYGSGVEIAFAPARRGDIRVSVGDPRRARAALDFGASVDLKDGLRQTLDWMASTQLPDHAR
jgi:UDP-glucose 4-epimerase